MFGLGAPTKKAVIYLRHSRENAQENSLEIQRQEIEKFAKKYNIEIIGEESDDGVSGLTADRPGFRNLFSKWVFNKDAPHIDFIIVYDMSRWGRFQDPNEAGYYAHQCQKRGITIQYVNRGKLEEALDGDEQGQLLQHILTPTERFIAAQHSAQLSPKTWLGCVKVIEQGFSAGGSAPYGLMRLLLGEERNEKREVVQVMKRGDKKFLSNQRVKFTPATDQSAEVVRNIFAWFTKDRLGLEDVAKKLNSQSIPSPAGRKWNREKIMRILTREEYIGIRVYNKTWHRLKKGKKRANPQSAWIRRIDAFPAIVSKEVFLQAQKRLDQIIPARKNISLQKIREAERMFIPDFEKACLSKGISSDDLLVLRHELPVAFAAIQRFKSSMFVCFSIPERLRKHDTIIGIGVDGQGMSKQIFLIPSSAFGKSNYVLISEEEKSFKEYQLLLEKAEEKILSIAERVTKSYSDLPMRGLFQPA